jgi:uncharacterized membrane protein YbhN (UPF0104 family)
MPAQLDPRHLARRLLELAFLGALVVAGVSALPGLGDVRSRFADASPGFVALAAGLELASCLSYVVVFRDVFCTRMSWRFSYQLGMAEQATNVLLPTGGAGGLALGAWALRQGGMSGQYIGRRSVAFFLITSTPNFVCAAVVGGLLLAGALPGTAPIVPTAVLTALACAAIVVVVALPKLLRRVRRRDDGGRIRRNVRTAAVTLANGVRDAGPLLRSGRPGIVGGAAGYMGFDLAALAAAFAAFGGAPRFGPLVFAYVIGQLGGLIPLPGGIGGTDGGLIGAMVLYGTPLPQAAAAVLAYRAFQLGIPAVLGVVAFLQLRRTLARSTQPAALCAQLAEPLPAAGFERSAAA